MSILLKQTIGNDAWMRANKDKVKKALPKEWTEHSQQTLLQIGFQLKVAGVDWRSTDELAKILVLFIRTGLMLRNGDKVKVAP